MISQFKDNIGYNEIKHKCSLDILKSCAQVSRKLALNNEDITQEFAELYAACTPIKILQCWHEDLDPEEGIKYDITWYKNFIESLKEPEYENDFDSDLVQPGSDIPEEDETQYIENKLRFYRIMCKEPIEITEEEKRDAFRLISDVFYGVIGVW
jgi:hypothetical protein